MQNSDHEYRSTKVTAGKISWPHVAQEMNPGIKGSEDRNTAQLFDLRRSRIRQICERLNPGVTDVWRNATYTGK